ncbi:MAG: hypothetical protein ACUVS5_06470 [Anaerolineae bacterium]
MAMEVPPAVSGMPGRLRSGLLFALAGFLVGLGVGFLATVCTVPVAALLGAAAGYLAARWEASPTVVQARQAGSLAGLLAGGSHTLGTLAGGALASLWASQTVLDWLVRSGGFAVDPSLFWASAAGTLCCTGGLGLALAAGFGALGGATWYGWRGPGRQAAEVPGAGPLSVPGRSAVVWMAGILGLLVCCLAGFLLVAALVWTGNLGGVGL